MIYTYIYISYGDWTTRDYVAKKARESYGDNNLMGHPYLDKKASRNMRITPLHEHLVAEGAQMGVHNGWEVPHWFALTEAEKGSTI